MTPARLSISRCFSIAALASAMLLSAPLLGHGFYYDQFGDGFWDIVNQASGQALVVSADSASQASVNGGDFAQQFELLLNLEDGTYRIRNRDSLRCIGAKNGATGAGTAVVEINYTGSNDQRWNFVGEGGGFWQIVNAASNLALQTDNGNPANVTLQPRTTSALQHWQFNYQTHYPKKGLAGWDNLWGEFGASWGYNWGGSTGAWLPDSCVFEPMKDQQYWPATGDLGGGYGPMHSTAKPVYIMGFNEPDRADQANMSVSSAIGAWPDLQNQNVPLVSPASSSAFNGWLGDFYKRIGTSGYRVDYTAVHWYATPDVDSMINQIDSVAGTWGRAVWLTEFGVVDWAGNQTWSEEDVWRFLAEFMWRAEDDIQLKRYSLFVFSGDPPAAPWSRVGARSNILKADNTTLTSLGELYAAWDGDRSIRPRVAYMVQNQQTMHRLSASTANSQFPGGQPQFPSPVSIRFGGAQSQWTLLPSPNSGQYFIVSLLDGRRLHTDGQGVDLAPAGTLGASVEWTVGDAGTGYFYLDNPAAHVALRSTRYNNGDGSPSWIDYGVIPSGQPSDNTRFRLVKPFPPVAVPNAPGIPTGVAAIPRDRSVWLSWSGTGATYTVYRAATSGGPYTAIATNLSMETFVDNTALNGVTYYYAVTASNTLLETSAYTNQAAATPQAALAFSGLAADYKFESGDAKDSSGNNLNGAVIGGVTFFSPGKVDASAASFDGATGYIQIPVSIANDFSIAFWMRTTATGGAGGEWYNGNGLVDGEVPGSVADFGTSLLGGKVAFGVGNPDTTIVSTSAVNDGSWHHVAVTRNGTSGAMQMYIDGTLQTSAFGPTGPRSAPTNLRLGSIQSGSGFFNGALDEVRLYTYPLNPSEVAALAVSRNSLVAEYRFENNALDSSGMGNDGIASGGVAYVAGKAGASAAQFNGAGSSIQIPASLIDDFSIACWVKTTMTAATGQWWNGAGIVDGEVQGSVNDFGMTLVGNKAAFGVGNPDTTITSTSAIDDGQWHHVAATRASGSGAMRLYVDGALQSSATGPLGPRTAPPALRIGAIQPGYGWLAGAVDEVRLYNYALSAGQLGALVNPPLAPWVDSDIGIPSAEGYASYLPATGVWKVGGSGADIWLGSDQFNFLSQSLAGDGSIVTRVTALPTNADGTSNANSKAGVMFRSSNAATAPFIGLVFDSSQGIQLISRPADGAQAAQTGANVTGVLPPFWLRLTRGGNFFLAAYSTVANPGTNDWALVGSASVPLPHTALAGVAVTSHNDGTLSEAVFDNLRLNANTAPAISTVANQSIQQNTATAVLPVTVGDLETPPASLALSVQSSNTALAPNAGIVLGGSGAIRTVQVTPASNQAGVATITLTVSDGQLTSSSAFLLTVQAPPAGLWRQQWFGSTANTGSAADNADPNHDGITNFWARAFGLNPTVVNLNAWPVVDMQGGNLRLAYTKNLSATDLVYQVLWSTDLKNWSSSGVTDSLISTDGVTQRRQGEAPLSLGNSIFLRLQVTSSP